MRIFHGARKATNALLVHIKFTASILALIMLMGLPGEAVAQASTKTDMSAQAIPEVLRPWVQWIEYRHPEKDCIPLGSNGLAPASGCLWTSAMVMEKTGDQILLSFSVKNLAKSTQSIELPHTSKYWPKLSSGAKELSIAPLTKGGAPFLNVPPEFTGSLTISLPSDAAVSGIVVNGLPNIVIEKNRGVWSSFNRILTLQDKAVATTPISDPLKEDKTAVNAMQVEFYHTLIDGQIPELITKIRLINPGAAKVIKLQGVLPKNAAIISVQSSGLNISIADDKFEALVKPGEYLVEVQSLLPEALMSDGRKVVALSGSVQLPDSEYWFLKTDPNLRRVNFESATPVDVSALPNQYASLGLPGFSIPLGQSLGVKIQKASLVKTDLAARASGVVWLHLSNERATYSQSLDTTNSVAGVLNVGKEWDLRQATVNRFPAVIAQDENGKNIGYGSGAAKIKLVSERDTGMFTLSFPASLAKELELKASSWDINLPPGWRVLGVSGPVETSQSWVASFNLWDWFIMILILWCSKSLLGIKYSLIIGISVLIGRLHFGAPFMAFLPVLIAPFIIKLLPPGAFRKVIIAFTCIFVALLTAGMIGYSTERIQKIVHPILDDKGQPYKGFARVNNGGGATLGGVAQDSSVPSVPMSAPVSVDEVADSAQMQENKMIPGEAGGTPQAARIAKRALSSTMNSVARESAKPVAPMQVQQSAFGAAQAGSAEPDWSWQKVRIQGNVGLNSTATVTLYLVPSWLHRVLSIIALLGFWISLGAIVKSLWSAINSKQQPVAPVHTEQGS